MELGCDASQKAEKFLDFALYALRTAAADYRFGQFGYRGLCLAPTAGGGDNPLYAAHAEHRRMVLHLYAGT